MKTYKHLIADPDAIWLVDRILESGAEVHTRDVPPTYSAKYQTFPAPSGNPASDAGRKLERES
jgi:hypothetical protein